MSLNDDIAASMDGTADPAARRRVAAAVATDKTVRARIALLRAAEEAPEDSEPISPGSAERLRARMLSTARSLAQEAAAPDAAPPEASPPAGAQAARCRERPAQKVPARGGRRGVQ